MKLLTTEEFIERAINVHGDKYGYDSVVYVNSHSNVKIWCKTHKEYFLQESNAHMRGSGCPKCCGTMKSTKKEFIEKARLIHDDIYIYDKVKYVNCETKVMIYCKEHNEYFLQTPIAHLRGQGCIKCAGVFLKTTEQFIEKARSIHNDIYNYDKVKYINGGIKVYIYCKEHREYFLQTPRDHLQGCGCPKCSGKNKTTDEFIKEAIDVHGDKYGYENILYVNATTKMNIYCKKHNEYFLQTSNSHLGGAGCPICNESRGEKKINKILYKHNIKYLSQKRFDDCRNKKPLPFDFYLPDYNICIEYQGRQHYQFVNFGGKLTKEKMEENFKIIQSHDKIKKDYCLMNDITLIEIPYWDFNNIEKILNKEFLTGVNLCQ